MRFLDSTPVGRIISRFTKDMRTIDQAFSESAYVVADMTVTLIIRFIAAVWFVPLFSLPAIVSTAATERHLSSHHS
jgi:ABC-type multidrug transport system fused ATPase/permease subunit